jgi:hypothetical protein
MLKKKIIKIFLFFSLTLIAPSIAIAETSIDDLVYQETTIEWDINESNNINNLISIEDIIPKIMLEKFSIILIFVLIIIVIPLYIYNSLTYMNIAKKLNHPNLWFAWVPVLKIILHFQLGEMSGWYTLLMLIPIVNVFVYIIGLMNICKKRGVNKFLSLFFLVPVANLIILGILAWRSDIYTNKVKE